MKTVSIALVLLAAFCPTSTMACDKVDAAKVQFVLSEIGTEWSETDGRVTLHWGRAWDGAPRAQRLALLHAFAEGDGCLTGQSREISFYRNGKLVGQASPASGVVLISDAATAQASSGSPPSVQDLARCPN